MLHWAGFKRPLWILELASHLGAALGNKQVPRVASDVDRVRQQLQIQEEACRGAFWHFVLVRRWRAEQRLSPLSTSSSRSFFVPLTLADDVAL